MGIKKVVLELPSPYPLTVEEYDDGSGNTSYAFLFKANLILYSYGLFSLHCTGNGFPVTLLRYRDKAKKIKGEKELIRIVSEILNSIRAREIAESIREWEMKEKR